jgi:hypothetical protein
VGTPLTARADARAPAVSAAIGRFHTDKCAALQPAEIAADSEARVVEAHPLVSSVLYLTGEGGPTAVFDQLLESCDCGTLARPTVPAQVLVSAPSSNRLLLFDGRLLHGVLHRPNGPAAGLRRTLLINWWEERPRGAATPSGPQPRRSSSSGQ